MLVTLKVLRSKGSRSPLFSPSRLNNLVVRAGFRSKRSPTPVMKGVDEIIVSNILRTTRARKWNRRSKVSGSSQRNLAYALSELTKIAYKLNLPRNVLETASMIYRQVVKKRLIRGRSVQGIAAASIYMSCRKCNVVRTLEEVGKAVNISKKQSGRNYRFLVRKLKTQVPPVKVKNYVSRFVSHLSLSGNVESLTMQIIRLATDLRMTSGRGPAGIAAASTYIASILCGERRTQGEIAKKAQVTEVTIRNRYKEIAQKISFEMNL
jgi:transcription initiation factor TFIIB